MIFVGARGFRSPQRQTKLSGGVKEIEGEVIERVFRLHFRFGGRREGKKHEQDQWYRP